MHSHTTELLPCPHCGGTAAFVPRAVNLVLQKDPSDPKFGVSVICGKCAAESPNMVDEAHAASAWNRRSYATALCQQAPATKDEALRVAREALRLAREAIEPLTEAQIKLHRIPRDLDVRLDAALRTIALAVEGPRTLCPVTYCHRSIEERDTAGCDHCNHPAAPAVQSVALGDPKAAFEAAMREKHPEWSFTPDPVFGYHNERTRCAWEGWQVAASASGAVGETAPTTYAPSREVVQQALELVDRIRDSHESWGGWSGIPQTCERITNMLRYGAAAGLPGTSNGQEN